MASLTATARRLDQLLAFAKNLEVNVQSVGHAPEKLSEEDIQDAMALVEATLSGAGEEDFAKANPERYQRIRHVLGKE